MKHFLAYLLLIFGKVVFHMTWLGLCYFTVVQTHLSFHSNTLENVLSGSFNYIVLGDFNIDILNSININLNNVLSNYTLLVNEPTYVSGSLLEHVYVDNDSLQKFLLKGIVEWADPCKCVILLFSRILWHKRINTFLKEWRFWYLILTGHFPP